MFLTISFCLIRTLIYILSILLMQEMVQRVLNMATEESDNPDLRDRYVYAYLLLSQYYVTPMQIVLPLIFSTALEVAPRIASSDIIFLNFINPHSIFISLSPSILLTLSLSHSLSLNPRIAPSLPRTLFHTIPLAPLSLSLSNLINLRGYVYWRLLSSDPEAARAVVLSEKPEVENNFRLRCP